MSETTEISLLPYIELARRAEPMPMTGRVVRTVGLLVESRGPRAQIGELCELHSDQGPPLMLEVVGFRDGNLQTVPLGNTTGIRPGDIITARGRAATMPVGEGLLGRVLDGLGRPIDSARADPRAGRGAVVSAAAQSAVARQHHRAARHGRPRDRHAADGRTRPARRLVRRQRRR